MPMTFRLFWLCMLCVFALVGHATPAANTLQAKFNVYSQTRELGYHLADITIQTITVQAPHGFVLDTSSLPSVGNKTYFDLVKVTTSQRWLPAYTEHTITLHWQNFRSVQEVRSYKLGALALQFVKDKLSIKVPVKAASIIVSPVIPTVLDASHLQPRADARPAQKSYVMDIAIMTISALGLLSALVYLGWKNDWLALRAKRALPFRRAFRQISALRNTQTPESVYTAIKAIRNAFDVTQQASMSTEQLPQLFAKHPHYLALAHEIRQFFNTSDVFLFSNQPLNTPIVELKRLAKKLMQLERG